ncbi:hypothetical protein IU451_28995 [Nocardia cyriacigeorgica]|uniref:hypothetical protein n=1 Tax=Nocardia cyriacigeorgica TaxID=135487 RepID=UPI001895AA48|nr:hypothetical protein [Nocardia cyriacigeorgica]MBF6326541.1 hypothetical protein [Nocardia cyriacigeorgica]
MNNPLETSFARAIPYGLQRRDMHVYGGTVPLAEVTKRRAKNRMARKSRQQNRG